MATGIPGTTARQYATQQVHYLRKRVTFADEGIETVIGIIPAGASVIGGGAHIVTAFDDTATIDVGFMDGSTTDDSDAYATALAATAVGFIPLDVLGSTANIQQTVDTKVTVTVNDGTGAVSVGAADIIVLFVPNNDE